MCTSSVHIKPRRPSTGSLQSNPPLFTQRIFCLNLPSDAQRPASLVHPIPPSFFSCHRGYIREKAERVTLLQNEVLCAYARACVCLAAAQPLTSNLVSTPNELVFTRTDPGIVSRVSPEHEPWIPQDNVRLWCIRHIPSSSITNCTNVSSVFISRVDCFESVGVLEPGVV